MLSESSLAAGRRRLSTRRAREPFLCCCCCSHTIHPAIVAFIVVAVVVVAVPSSTTNTTTTQCCRSSYSPLTTPEARYLYPLLAVRSRRHLCSALPLPLLLLCPARPIGHTPNPHPAPVAPSQLSPTLLGVLLSPTRTAASTSLTSPNPTKLSASQLPATQPALACRPPTRLLC